MQKTEKNAMLCDTATGMCELPGHDDHVANKQTAAVNKAVKIVYYTDPICSSCWGIEPQLWKLKLEYGHEIEVEYRMGGLLPSWEIYNSGGISKPSDVAAHWDEVSHHYEMPIDGDVWLEDPLPSSYPPSIAFKAAQLQDKDKALAFMRRIREMVFLEKKNITKWEHLATAAQETGLDVVQLKQDYEGKAVQLFEEDLAMARGAGVRGFPTLILTNKDGEQTMLRGSRPYKEFEAGITKLAPAAHRKPISTDRTAVLKKFKTITAKEYAVMFDISFAQAEKELKELEEKKVVSRYDTKNGAIWRMK
ncbi:MAG: DsbA family protein [Sphingobacteriales bacterium]|nr:MAG: DsbA family protein [Sphingobacteriales bacterium]